VKRVRLSRLAEADLDEIWLYVAGDGGVAVANRLIDDIMDRIVLLATQPNAGRLRDELAGGLRSVAVQSHIIYYRPEPSHILVARVLHGHRDQASALGPQDEG
jgi:toxin ParE1/3/4